MPDPTLLTKPSALTAPFGPWRRQQVLQLVPFARGRRYPASFTRDKSLSPIVFLSIAYVSYGAIGRFYHTDRKRHYTRRSALVALSPTPVERAIRERLNRPAGRGASLTFAAVAQSTVFS
jgi:hypothetical protein